MDKKFKFDLLNNKYEIELVKLLSNFPGVINKASRDLKPNYIANYSYDLAQKFNEFYHTSQVISEDKELMKARLVLVEATRQVLENGLNLLGIHAPEEM